MQHRGVSATAIRVPARRPAILGLFLALVLGTVAPRVWGQSRETPASTGVDRRFLDALREREYFDTAIEFLDQIAARPALDPDLAAVLPYERGVTYLRQARIERSPDRALESLQLAERFLQDFLARSPQHELAADAGSELGQIKLQLGKLHVQEANNPGKQGERAERLKQAREAFAAARAVFAEAAARHEAAMKAYPVHIDEQQQPEQFAARARIESRLMTAQFNLANLHYEEAQTFDEGSPQRNEKLTTAAREFAALHDRYRTQIVGLKARAFQGKCFEEQGEFQKAMGIYNEILGHPGQHPELDKLRDQVMLFRLQVLHRREDFQLVLQEAEAWLAAMPAKRRTRVGVGVLWELARAQEALAGHRATPQEQQLPLLRAAQKTAQEVNGVRTVSDYRAVSQAMLVRLAARLETDLRDPRDFAGAMGVVGVAVDKIKELRAARDAAEAGTPERAKAEQDLRLHLDETLRLLNLAQALSRADPRQLARPDPKTGKNPDYDQLIQELNRVRLQTEYVLYLLGRHYEAATIGEFLSRRYAGHEPSGNAPIEAAYIALVCYDAAWRDKANLSKQIDVARMIDLANHLATTWPSSPRAVEARMMLGRLYAEIQQPAEAAKWYMQIPESSEEYLAARLAAGQAYWAAYLTAGLAPEAERPPVETINGFRDQAREILRTAIEQAESKLPDSAEVPENLAAAKLSFAQMANATGQYAEAVRLIETARLPVLAALRVDDEEERPERGVKSARFASAVHQELLRAYIGLQDLDAAKRVMNDLEKIETAAGGQITSLYVSLGRQIKAELDRLAKTDAAQHAAVLQSFESSLENLLARPDGQTFNSLAWIGETYMALGESAGRNDRGKGYYTQAAKAWQKVVDGAEGGAGGEKLPPESLAASRFRLVTCRRMTGEFEAALQSVRELLKARPNALDIQTEAARILQDWAASGTGSTSKLFEQAVVGIDPREPGGIWGWREIASRIDRTLESDPDSPYAEQFLEARYNIAACWSKAAEALASQDRAERDALLRLAEREIQYTAAVRLLDDAWYERFNDLYGTVRGAQGLATEDLPRNSPLIERPVAGGPSSKPDKAAAEKTPAVAATAPSAKAQGGGTAIWLLAFLVLGGAAMAAIILFGRRSGRSRALDVSTTMSPPPDFTRLAERTPVRRESAARSAPAAGTPAAAPEAGAPRRPSPRRPPAGPPAGGAAPPRQGG